ncbi:MAG: IS66 family insertion sequence element accessory protein TnpA [Candidatus Angelobacter sp.]
MAEDGGMGKRSAEEVRGIIAEFRNSGLTRREFCERRGIPVTTLDYYRHRLGRETTPRMVKVTVKNAPVEVEGNFTLLLANGRRIESSWRFAEAELARLIRVAESA